MSICSYCVGDLIAVWKLEHGKNFESFFTYGSTTREIILIFSDQSRHTFLGKAAIIMVKIHIGCMTLLSGKDWIIFPLLGHFRPPK